MKNQLIVNFEKRVFSETKKLPSFRPGDTIRVYYKIPEEGKTGKFRIQQFEGVCIRYKKGTADASFTVRKIGANCIGVERIFPVYSPYIDRIDLVAGGRVRRARLFYLRDRAGKAARIASRRLTSEELQQAAASR